MAKITNLHTFGWRLETVLLDRMQSFLKEPLIKTDNRFAVYDFDSEKYQVELKCRKDILSSTYSTWLVPAHKLETVASCKEKIPVLFYYFELEDSLFVCFPKDHDQTGWLKEVPKWKQSQVHVWIPSTTFTRIN